MMALIGHWVKSLIIIVLLGNLAEFILPKGDLKKYAGLIVGLVLLLAMVSPIWSLMHQLQHSSAPSALLGPGTGANFTALVQQEQLAQAEAMVMSYPQVISCQLTRSSPGHYQALVKTSAPLANHTLSQYVQDALAITTGESASSLHVQLIVVNPALKRTVTQIKP
ncbi:stage III sporulation protein AF [Sulfobacillus thermosulfidooxidans]|uniref:stage III sporulation protein AF n=1 Tax=Sulfobacillus thermosulfidooxidans TaxID=28034 RepID=UPI00096B6FCE|nr:stage III sporulation protein AF [Sulfobacillus thermosulfidooxidans]OLZ08545.1 hypothetical protein BFX05_03170 [Sulfobacillus thermosulfidooxidans]OLZ13147.1 hypothetical protein BFX06_11420 [Sulfobacillus thermosulfidooxidans]OLZ21527.1 hypothetical protein BFX07_11845 [Sulfobacillus thermosulfidooxidans]